MLSHHTTAYRANEILSSQHNYWQQVLQGGISVLELPLDHPRRLVSPFRSTKQSFSLPTPLVDALQRLSHVENTTIATTLLTAFKVLLVRYTGQSTILVSTPYIAQVDDQSYNTLLPICTDLAGNPAFRTVLQHVHRLLADAYAHANVSFGQVAELLSAHMDHQSVPLFQVIYAYNVPAHASWLSNLHAPAAQVTPATQGFDLALHVTDQEGKLQCDLLYNAELFEPATITRLISHFQILLESITAEPTQPIGTLRILSKAERQQLLVDWNATEAPVPPYACIHHAFEAQVARTPDAIAAVFGDQRLTYRELNQRANQLAHYLRGRGVGPEFLVGICIERSLDLLVSLFGIFKAGGAYVPLDPAYPRERLAFMLKDAHVSLLLTQQELLPTLNEVVATVQQDLVNYRPNTVCIDTQWHEIATAPTDNLPGGASAENLAYVIYTSGSTGRPKGVLLQHYGLCNLAEAQIQTFGVRTDSQVLQFSSICFDASIFEVVLALNAGATLHLAARSALMPGPELVDLLREREISVVTLPPSVLATLPNEPFPALQTIIVAGEACSAELVARWSAGRRFFNAYGPTETTVWATVAECVSGVRPPIGRPIINVQIYLLDAQLQPVPVGVAGEIYIGGAGVARGYLNQPELNAERFIHNPFSEGVLPTTIYKSGDLARYLPDGDIEYLGRIDQQVKIRGFRIEPGEIEAVLQQHPQVQDATVIDQEFGEGSAREKRLVAYLVPAQAQSVQLADSSLVGDVRRFLQQRVPQYMVPAVFVVLAALPLTPSGKVDRRALPVPDGSRPELDAEFVAPTTSVETTLAQIWAAALGLDQVGVHDNFFELGGDSILSIQIISKANQAGLRISTRQLFLHPTVAELSAIASEAPVALAPQGLVTGPTPLTPIQSWFFEQDFPNPHHWNQAMLLETPSDVDPQRLEQALAQIVQHHDALRLCFTRDEAGWQQYNAGSASIPFFQQIDLSALPPAEQRRVLEATAAQVQASLDLGQAPRWRTTWFYLGPEQFSRLLIVVNYVSIDGVSWRILLEDIQQVYEQLSRQQAIRLPLKTTSYQQWAQHLVEHARSDLLRNELDYWLDAVRASDVRLPRDFEHGENTMASAGTVTVTLGVDATRALLQDVPKAYHTQINDVLLTALVETYTWWTRSGNVLITLESHGREEIFDSIDLSRTVGWFTSIFPLHLRLAGDGDLESVLIGTKELLRQIPQRGIGYGLLRYLSGDAEISRQLRTLPKPELRFNYLGQFDQVLSGTSMFRRAHESFGPTRDPGGKRTHILVAEGMVTEGQLRFEWTYSANLHQRATIERVASHYLETLQALINLCLTPNAGGSTRSDFPLVDLNEQQFDELARMIEQLGTAAP